jgi:hypothetical protein
MARIVLSALLKPFRGGVKAKSAEFPELEATSWTVGGAVTKLRQLLSQKLSRHKVETSCTGDPISPVPKTKKGSLTVPIDVSLSDKTASG